MMFDIKKKILELDGKQARNTSELTGEQIKEIILENERLKYKIERLELDCGASNCQYAKSLSGMRTNGGCHCKDDIKTNKKIVDSLNEEK